jgi:ATP-dependent Clp protease ATP-binding subunit ClpC
MEKHSVSRLVGSPPGYVGYDEGGQLTEAVRRKPYSVLLLDEIEKAHPDVFNILLQILEDGKLTDAQGRTVDFRNTIVIMTSNIGAAQISKNQSLGFTIGTRPAHLRRHEGPDHGRAEEGLPPRAPQPHRRGHRLPQAREGRDPQIVDLMMKRGPRARWPSTSVARAHRRGAELLVEKGYDPAMGARPLRRAIQRYIEDPLADEVLSQNMPPGSTVIVDRAPDEEGGEVKITIQKPERKREPVGVGAKAAGEQGAGEGGEPAAGADAPPLPELPEAEGESPTADEADTAAPEHE